MLHHLVGLPACRALAAIAEQHSYQPSYWKVAVSKAYSLTVHLPGAPLAAVAASLVNGFAV